MNQQEWSFESKIVRQISDFLILLRHPVVESWFGWRSHEQPAESPQVTDAVTAAARSPNDVIGPSALNFASGNGYAERVIRTIKEEGAFSAHTESHH
jgi:hypothetical protein